MEFTAGRIGTGCWRNAAGNSTQESLQFREHIWYAVLWSVLLLWKEKEKFESMKKRWNLKHQLPIVYQPSLYDRRNETCTFSFCFAAAEPAGDDTRNGNSVAPGKMKSWEHPTLLQNLPRRKSHSVEADIACMQFVGGEKKKASKNQENFFLLNQHTSRWIFGLNFYF